MRICLMVLLLLSVLTGGPVQAQAWWRYGPEAGYAFNQISWSSYANGALRYQNRQTASPVLGMQGMLVLADTWVFRAGLQYQWLGKTTLSQNSSGSFYSKDVRQQLFQKVCAPLGVGIWSGSPDFKVSLVLGYRGTGYVMGHVRETRTYNRPNIGSGGSFLSYNPFTGTPGEEQMDRPRGQFWMSLSAVIASRVHLTGNLAIGGRYPYRINDDLEYEMVFGNSDLYFTVGYLFGKGMDVAR